MSEWLILLFVPIIIGVVLLIIEYKTSWFANHITRRDESRHNGEDASDWVTVIDQVRMGLHKTFGHDLIDIDFLSWESKKNGSEVHIKAKLKIFTQDQGDKWAIYNIIADEKGNIKKCKEERSFTEAIL